MKILVGGIMGVILATTCANAALTTEQLRAACEKSDKTVWVEATNACIPKNPCNDSKYDTYCDNTFSDLHVASPVVGSALAAFRSEVTGDYKVFPFGCGTIDGNYLGCTHTTNNDQTMYIVYSFASLDEPNTTTANQDRMKGACIAYEGVFQYSSPHSTCMLNTQIVPDGMKNMTKQERAQEMCKSIGIAAGRIQTELVAGVQCTFINSY